MEWLGRCVDPGPHEACGLLIRDKQYPVRDVIPPGYYGSTRFVAVRLEDGTLCNVFQSRFCPGELQLSDPTEADPWTSP